MQTQHCVLAVPRMLQEIISMHRCCKTTSILFVYTGLSYANEPQPQRTRIRAQRTKQENQIYSEISLIF
jgi:hypothetical protein